jgi:hypothetical protein
MKNTNFYWLTIVYKTTTIHSRLVYNFDNFDIDHFYEFCQNTAVSEVNRLTSFVTYTTDKVLSFTTTLIHSQSNETT